MNKEIAHKWDYKDGNYVHIADFNTQIVRWTDERQVVVRDTGESNRYSFS